MQKNSGIFATSNKSAFKPFIKNQHPAYLSDIDEISKSLKGMNLNENDFNKTKLSAQSAFTAFPKKENLFKPVTLTLNDTHLQTDLDQFYDEPTNLTQDKNQTRESSDETGRVNGTSFISF